MNILQPILVGILFIGALIYLIRLFKRNFNPKNTGCAKGCGCDTAKSIKGTKLTNTEH